MGNRMGGETFVVESRSSGRRRRCDCNSRKCPDYYSSDSDSGEEVFAVKRKISRQVRSLYFKLRINYD